MSELFDDPLVHGARSIKVGKVCRIRDDAHAENTQFLDKRIRYIVLCEIMEREMDAPRSKETSCRLSYAPPATCA